MSMTPRARKPCLLLPRLSTVRVKLRGSGRVGSGRVGPGRVWSGPGAVTGPDPRKVENILTHSDSTRPASPQPNPTRESWKTPRTDPWVGIMTRKQPWFSISCLKLALPKFLSKIFFATDLSVFNTAEILQYPTMELNQLIWRHVRLSIHSSLHSRTHLHRYEL